MAAVREAYKWVRRRVRRKLLVPAQVAHRAARFRLGLEPERPRKVFCLGMQRTGTTSFGRFCAGQLGLIHRGFDYSISNFWTHDWMRNDPERIFRSADFRTGEVFEDDPWWCPEFYRVLVPRFPDARFVLITRDTDAWWRSLCAHSNGRSPGHTELHAKIYGREAEFDRMVAAAPSRHAVNWQGFSLEGMRDHYVACYERHAAGAEAYFAETAPERFLHVRLEDPEKFRKVAVFLGFPDGTYADVHANAIASVSPI